MTLDYNVIIPITITVALSYGVRKAVCPRAFILSSSLGAGTIFLALRANLSQMRHVKDIMQTGITALPTSSTLGELAKIVLEHPKQSHFVVYDRDRIVGVVGREAALGALEQLHPAKTLGQVVNTHFVVVPADAMLVDLLGAMYAKGTSIALVAASATAPSLTDIQGIVTEYETADAMIRSVDLFCD